mmetsp:Transcript_76690/g.237496  ORF Transcript_76690/g.237496 Transcript_76690/m.237496 type:complete len:375 (+) Transcript_76690:112-1236(+)|eukprot:CAMPEP_0204598812 /NCGR_PEP_ID=MMETSP0661-20131031/54502_1 /ASSEMBLY_ACC=CAM_ASM_000606 /TAXON_ID=109239 /ORGANISM="Alexandrium margalefi, Strain AMGDE01CS-322" /LENGTH=374 /DNA_ID=CAMNT_0051609521 /DNA_START=108 /DNA_END=1232 /DNA_ORIENTATION=-
MDDERSRKLFVGKLPQDITEDEIRMIFNTYGRTTDVHLMSTHQQLPGQDRCAFVTYETEDAAKVAAQVLHGVYKFREESHEPINVGPAFRRGGKGDSKGESKGDPKGSQKGSGGKGGFSDRGGDRPGGGKGGHDRGYDRGPAPPSLDRGDRGFDRGMDRGVGRGADRGVERGGYDRGPDRGNDRGYDRGGKGFERPGDRGKGGYDRGPVYDRGPPPDRGHDRGHDRAPPPRGYDRGPERGPPPRDYPPPRDSKGSRKGGGSSGGGSPTKLYIGNLPADITRDAIEMVFGTYGRVMDVHIMLARAKNGQSCAFCVFSSLAEARTCMAAMQQGYEIRPGEGNIFVKFADEGKGGDKGGDKGGEKGRGGGSDRYRPY